MQQHSAWAFLQQNTPGRPVARQLLPGCCHHFLCSPCQCPLNESLPQNLMEVMEELATMNDMPTCLVKNLLLSSGNETIGLKQ